MFTARSFSLVPCCSFLNRVYRFVPCCTVPFRQSEPKDGLLSPVLSASEVGDDGLSATKRHFGRSGVGGGAGVGGQAPVSGTTVNNRSLLAGGAGGGPAGGRWGGGGGVVGEMKSAMYEAFKQVRRESQLWGWPFVGRNQLCVASDCAAVSEDFIRVQVHRVMFCSDTNKSVVQAPAC